MRFFTIISILSIIFMPNMVTGDDIDDKIEQTLYPAVRVLAGGGGGSGILLYSDDRDKDGEYESYVMTNYHIVDRNIFIEKQWNSLTKKYEEVEKAEQANVELFTYTHNDEVVLKTPIKADIVAWNAEEDICLLKLVYPFEIKYTAKIVSEKERLRLFQRVFVSGSPLLVEPIFTEGRIVDLSVDIDGLKYFSSNANVFFGNSGGGIFANFGGEWRYVGIPSRVAVSRGNVVSHLAYFITPKRIHKFIRTQKLDFLLDGDKTPEQSRKARKELTK